MSSYTTFPDAIVFPDGTIRLVTGAAKLWAYSNTDMKNICTDSTVPDYVDFEDSIPPMMEDVGLVVRRERVPVGHYRSRRRRWPKPTTTDDAKPVDFMQRVPKHYRQDAMCRAYGRHRARNHRKMQEASERRKRQEAQQDKQTVE
jgi:hypothetical protein